MLNIPEEIRLQARTETETCLPHNVEHASHVTCWKCRQESEDMLQASQHSRRRWEAEANGETYALSEYPYRLPEEEERESWLPSPRESLFLSLLFLLFWALCALFIVPENRQMERNQRIEREAEAGR